MEDFEEEEEEGDELFSCLFFFSPSSLLAPPRQADRNAARNEFVRGRGRGGRGRRGLIGRERIGCAASAIIWRSQVENKNVPSVGDTEAWRAKSDALGT